MASSPAPATGATARSVTCTAVRVACTRTSLRSPAASANESVLTWSLPLPVVTSRTVPALASAASPSHEDGDDERGDRHTARPRHEDGGRAHEHSGDRTRSVASVPGERRATAF